MQARFESGLLTVAVGGESVNQRAHFIKDCCKTTLLNSTSGGVRGDQQHTRRVSVFTVYGCEKSNRE